MSAFTNEKIIAWVNECMATGAERAAELDFHAHVLEMEADIANSWVECHAYSSPWKKFSNMQSLSNRRVRDVFVFENGKAVKALLMFCTFGKGDTSIDVHDRITCWEGVHEEYFIPLHYGSPVPQIFWRNTITNEKSYTDPHAR
jgi:hypothetical protein